ncbi:MAG TPA: hypothetical protein DEA08_14470, partial [Planctomycetes bacterium]|nr:hypothetical protein [Planctomycetota bacterium]
MAVEVGAKVGGEFLLEQELGRGQLGQTFLAKRGNRKKRYVVKVLDRDDYAYLLKTRYGSTRVNLEAVGSVRGFEKAWVEGDRGLLLVGKHYARSLAELMERGPMRGGQARQIILDAARIIAKAHEKGRVHGGLKPGNVLMGQSGVVISDFGLAEMTRRLGPDERRRYGEQVASAQEFCPPEDPSGEAPSAKGDVYALGAMLRKAVGGEVPEGLREVVSKATASAGERYADANELAEALGAAQTLTDTGVTEIEDSSAEAPALAALPAAVEEFDPLADDDELDLSGDELDLSGGATPTPSGAAPPPSAAAPLPSLSTPAPLPDLPSAPSLPSMPAAAAPATPPPAKPTTAPTSTGRPDLDNLLADLDLAIDGGSDGAQADLGSITGEIVVPDLPDSGDLLGGAGLLPQHRRDGPEPPAAQVPPPAAPPPAAPVHDPLATAPTVSEPPPQPVGAGADPFGASDPF